jgi:hypothetical protein
MLKPLKDLLEEADKFLGQTKVAAPAVSDEVSSLANTLAFATAIDGQFSQPEETTADFNSDFEKVAVAINKIAAEIEWDVMSKAERFEEAALARGYTESQVNEVLSKVAAGKIHKHLATLAAIGQLPLPQDDQNSLETKKEKAVGEEKRTLPLTRSLKGAG